MTAINRSAMLVLGLGLIIGSALGSEYSFGSKVYAGDSDVGRTLLPFPPSLQFPIGIEFWNVGTLAYDDQDVVYWHIVPANPIAVAANDIRLTPFGGYPAGSKVTPFDNDVGQPLTPAPGFWIKWLNLYGGQTQDMDDPIFAATLPGPIPSILNDVRLTQSEGMSAGTKLRNSDPDFSVLYTILPVLYTMPTLATGGIPFEYFDTNGNTVYDYPDDVYLHMPLAAPGQVNVNDVRLSGPA